MIPFASSREGMRTRLERVALGSTTARRHCIRPFRHGVRARYCTGWISRRCTEYLTEDRREGQTLRQSEVKGARGEILVM